MARRARLKKRPAKKIIRRRDVAVLMGEKARAAVVDLPAVSEHLEAPDSAVRRAAYHVVQDARSRINPMVAAMEAVRGKAMATIQAMIENPNPRIQARGVRAFTALSADVVRMAEAEVSLARAAMAATPLEIAAEAQVRLMGEMMRGSTGDGLTPEQLARMQASEGTPGPGAVGGG